MRSIHFRCNEEEDGAQAFLSCKNSSWIWQGSIRKYLNSDDPYLITV